MSIFARFARRFTATIATMAYLTVLLFLLSATAQAAPPILRSQGPCTKNSDDVCLRFTIAGVPKVVRALDFNAPSAGQALVSVMGSGRCSNINSADTQIIRLVTQIVNDPNAVATYAGPGGNRFRFTLPAYAGETGNYGTGVFNLASQRLFTISAASVQHYSLNISVPAMGRNIFCDVDSVALTVLFLPR
jgi:hypothetical protein